MKKDIFLLESTNKQLQESDDEKYIFLRIKDKCVFFKLKNKREQGQKDIKNWQFFSNTVWIIKLCKNVYTCPSCFKCPSLMSYNKLLDGTDKSMHENCFISNCFMPFISLILPGRLYEKSLSFVPH